MLTPTGERLTQPLVKELSTQKRLLLLCGRYEGFDERIRQGLRPREISIGDFVCNGGEVPAMVVIDTVMRYVPGVLGDPESLVEESHNDPGRLEYPQYTRPRVFRGHGGAGGAAERQPSGGGPLASRTITGPTRAGTLPRAARSEQSSSRRRRRKVRSHEESIDGGGRERRHARRKSPSSPSATRLTCISAFWKARRSASRYSTAW